MLSRITVFSVALIIEISIDFPVKEDLVFSLFYVTLWLYNLGQMTHSLQLLHGLLLTLKDVFCIRNPYPGAWLLMTCSFPFQFACVRVRGGGEGNANVHICVSICVGLVTNWIICLHRPEGNLSWKKAQQECTTFKFPKHNDYPKKRCHDSPPTLSKAS